MSAIFTGKTADGILWRAEEENTMTTTVPTRTRGGQG